MGNSKKLIKILSLLLLLLNFILAACGEEAATVTGNNKPGTPALTSPSVTPGQPAPTAMPTNTAVPPSNTPVQAPATVTPIPDSPSPNTTSSNLASPATTSSSIISPAATVSPAVPAVSPGTTVSAATQVQALLVKLWATYKARYMQQDGRVRDPQRVDISTSEGQSYALLRAVWQDDRPTFDPVLTWTVNNLQKPRGDKLFAYLWGKAPDNSWKVLDSHVATDADQDIALALLLASQRWNEPAYLNQALEIVNDLWDKAVITVKGRPYLVAGDWAVSTPRPVLNPSYFSPYTYRLFANIDPNKSHEWNGLIDSAYAVITGCTVNSFGESKPGKLPPNWCAIDKASGQFVSAIEQSKDFDTNFGYDAFRTIWRVAMDYRFSGEKRALSYLQSLAVMHEDWVKNQKLAAVYDHFGVPKDNQEELSIYAGGGLALLTVLDSKQADKLVTDKLLPTLLVTGQGDDPDPAHSDPSRGRTYYGQNWTWFGLAFYAGKLPLRY